MAVEVVPARLTHVGPIASRMREIDRIECLAMGHSPKQALRNGFTLSELALTALVDGRPEAMFGIVVTSALDRKAVPWMLGTDEVYRHGRELIKWGPHIIASLVDSSRVLSNLVSAQNSQAIRLLKRWGFTVEDEIQVIRDVPFRAFWMIR